MGSLAKSEGALPASARDVGRDHVAQQRARGSAIVEWSFLAVLFVLEWALAILLITTIKVLLSNPDMHFPYPMFSTFLMNLGTGFLALAVAQFRRAGFYAKAARSVNLPGSQVVVCWCRGLLNLKPRIDLADFASGLLPIGLFMGLEVGLSNCALRMLPVSLKTMIHACGPAMVVLCAWTCGLERLTWQLQVVIGLVVGGGLTSASSSLGLGSISGLGLAFAVGALALQGFRFCFTQLTLSKGRGALKPEKREDVLSFIGRLRAEARSEALLESGAAAHGMHRSASAPLKESPTLKSATLRKSQSQEDSYEDVVMFIKGRVGSKAAHVSKIEVMALTNPATAFVCLILAWFFEPSAFGTPVVGWEKVILVNLVCSIFVLLKMGLDLFLIQRTSALIFSLAGVVHNLLIVLSGVVIFGDRPSQMAWLGFAMTSAGVIFYAAHKANKGGAHH